MFADCGGLVNPADGSVDTASGTTYLETATYSCNTGYDLIGTTSRTCQADAWDGTPPTCDIKGMIQYTIIDFNEVDMRIYLPEKVSPRG